jgi:aryl-alcohol dehydrogenase-like predicted oxidoreductase
MSMPELALRYCLSNPVVSTVIPGIRSPEQAEINTAVSDGEYLPENILEEMQQFAWRKDFWFHEIDE